MKKYKVAMPQELEYIRQFEENEKLTRERKMRGFEPKTQDQEIDLDARIRLTPRGIEFYESMQKQIEFDNLKDLEQYMRAFHPRILKAFQERKKRKNVDNQRDCQLKIDI